jgi:hypothetical protein
MGGVLLLAAALATSASSHAASPRAKPDSKLNGAQRSIALGIYRNFLVVAEGQFGPVLQHQNFVLDTGTAPSIINSSVVSQLGLANVPSIFRAAGKPVSARAAIIPEFELGPIRIVSLPVYVQDLSQLERDYGIPIAGIIGLDVLSHSSFHLDYDKREIEFGNVSREGIPVPFDARAGIALADVSIDGKQARMLVDTGSDRVIVFGGNFSEAVWPVLRKTSEFGSSLVDPHMSVQVFSAAEIILGSRHFSVDRAYFLPTTADPAFDGLLGVRALGFRALSYDQSSATLYLQ